MDTLEFVSKIVGEVSWPITVFVLVLVLRKHIATLLTSLTRYKFKDLEFNFRRLEEAARKLPASDSPDLPNLDRIIYSSLEDQIFNASGNAPSAAILLAWATVETAISSAVARMAISAEPPQYRSAYHNLDQLRKYTNLPPQVADIIDEMMTLRNRVAYEDKYRYSVSPKSALSYSRTAVQLTRFLNSLSYKNKDYKEVENRH